MEKELFEIVVEGIEKSIEEEFNKERDNIPKDLDFDDKVEELYKHVALSLYSKFGTGDELWFYVLVFKKVFEFLKREEEREEVFELIDDIPQEQIEEDVERESVEVLREEMERAKEEVKEEEENKKETEKEGKKKKLLEKFKEFGKGDSGFERLFRQETGKFLISPHDREIFEEYAIIKFRYFVNWAWGH